MPANAYLALSSIRGSRPFAVPDEIRGTRRADDERCRLCRHHAEITGLTPRGQVETADLCWAYRKEILIARPTTPPCPRFASPTASDSMKENKRAFQGMTRLADFMELRPFE